MEIAIGADYAGVELKALFIPDVQALSTFLTTDFEAGRHERCTARIPCN